MMTEMKFQLATSTSYSRKIGDKKNTSRFLIYFTLHTSTALPESLEDKLTLYVEHSRVA